MKKVVYPNTAKEIGQMRSRYYRQLNMRQLEKDWSTLRNKIPCGFLYPKKLSKLLFADFHHLRVYYAIYLKHRIINSDDLDEARRIFNYKDKYGSIASFFMDKQNGFDLSTCYYCEMAFINKYTIDQTEDGLNFINQASEPALMKKLKLTTVDIPQQIVAGQPYWDINSFNSLFPRSNDKFRKVFSSAKDQNHFDLDHVLDKASCPLVALSLMNFVPSCPVCNERLKHSDLIGDNGIPDEKLSPTSALFDFDGNARFLIVPKRLSAGVSRKVDHPDDYNLKLDVSADYKPFANLFKLQERYDFHKLVALHWSDLKFRYNKSRIQLMANAIHDASFSPKRIEEDIFQKALDDKGRSCFAKLKRDMLK